MNKKLVGLAVAATLSMTAFAASAEDMFRDAWYLVPGVNYMHADGDLDTKSSGYGGFLSIGKELSPSWDLQGRFGYETSKIDAAAFQADTSVNGTTGIANASGRYKQPSISLDALYMFSRSNFRPFLLAGIGAARNKLDYSAPTLATFNGSKTSWLGELGLGVQYLFNDNIGFQADLREQWSKYKASGTSVLGNSDSRDGTASNTLLNIGGIFRFGAPAPVVAAAAPEPAPMPIAEPEPAPEPAPMAEPAPAAKCEPTMDTITIGAEKLFAFDKANLRKEGKAALDEAAAKIKANPEVKAVIVTGHTDRLGSDKYNQKLSERRAKQVADYLVSQGVDRSTIESSGKGESEPVVQCDGTKKTKKLISCLAPNRRVTIQGEGKKEMGCN